MSVGHETLTELQLHEPFHYVDESDPGAVGAGKYWLKVSTGELKRRNATDDDWDAVGGGGGSSISEGAYGSLPAAGNAGALYLPTDAPVILRDDGAAWQTFGPIHRFHRDTWPATAYNPTSETVTDHGWGQSILAPNNGSTGTTNWVGREKVAPSTPYKVDLFFRINAFVRQHQCWGFFIRDSSNGKWTGVQLNFGSAGGLAVLHQNSATSNASVPFTLELPLVAHDLFWRMEDDNTNIKFACSADGQNWYQFYSEARASFLTTPNRVGWALNNQTSAIPMTATLLHWWQH